MNERTDEEKSNEAKVLVELDESDLKIVAGGAVTSLARAAGRVVARATGAARRTSVAKGG